MTMVVEPEPMLEHPSERLTLDLAAEIEGALWAYDPIRQSGSMIGVTADDAGAVRLFGVVPSFTISEIAEYIARGVPGVTGVTSSLVSDTEIQSDVALAIAGDPSVGVSTDRITIGSLLGLVQLGGVVTAPEMADAEAAVAQAETLARAVTGVRDVANRIVPVGDDVESPSTDASGDEDRDGPDPEEVARAERLAVWRERASQ
jgi:osmotically-inducible protein OsmY